MRMNRAGSSPHGDRVCLGCARSAFFADICNQTAFRRSFLRCSLLLTIPAEPSFHSLESVDCGSPPTVEALLRSVRAGDEYAAVTLHEKIFPLVIRIIRSHLAPRTIEEDLCQIIFARIFHRPHQYSGLAPFEHWVSRVAINVCLNQIETERIRPELRYADLSHEQRKAAKQLTSSFAEIPEEQSELAREVVTKLLLKLEPEDRLVITMLHLEERSIAEIGSHTGWMEPVSPRFLFE
jgi:RNA polymerase sigma-70 factor (ECF subfamily)